MSKLIGTAPNQVPSNADLGTMAYQDYDVVAPVLMGGRRNLIINGDFKVWQRGTTVNTTDYSADRWMQWMTNSGVSNRNVNCTKQTGGPLGRNSTYIRYAPQVVDTGMEKFSWGQKIEKVNLDNIQSGQKMTLSFWIKKEQDLPVDNDMDIQILRPSNVDNWGTGYLYRNDYIVDQTIDSISFNSLSTEWTKYSYTFVPGDNALDNGMAVYWHVGDTNFNLGNTNPLISFTGVQLEVGEVATPFEYRSYGEELLLCQRYFERIDEGQFSRDSTSGSTSTEVLIGIGVSYSGTRCLCRLDWKQQKRVPPTISWPSSSRIQTLSAAQGWESSTSVSFRANVYGARIDLYAANAHGNGAAIEVRFDNSGSADDYINIDAEL